MVALKRIKSTLPKLILLLILFQVLINHGPADNNTAAYASETDDVSTEVVYNEKRVYDEAGLLTYDEVNELEAMCLEYGEKAGIEIYILTHNDSDAAYPEKYIEDFEDQLPVGDRVYFLYDVYNSEIFMEGYGLAETYIHSKRIDVIFDNVEDDLRNGNCFEAFRTYIIMSAEYMEDDSELNYDHDYIYDSVPDGFEEKSSKDTYTPNYGYSYHKYDYEGYYRKEALENNILLNFWFQLVVSFVIGGIAVGVMAYHSGGTMTAGARDYLDRSRGGLIGKRDQYIRTSVTRWRKPEANTSSGHHSSGSRGGFNASGFRGGVSSGGRSHSSGGRKL